MTPQENRKFGPEWRAELKLPLVSLPAEHIVEVGDFTSRLASLFPSIPLQEEGRVLVPVHPWQAERDLQTRFSSLFESGVARFSEHALPARPTMSFRSVILETEVGEDFHLKLPVAVQTTGATRTVSVAATQNGPAMSGFLKRLFAHREMVDSQMFQHLHLCAEPASFHIKDDDPDRSRFFSAILRKGPAEGRIKGNRWLLPAAALLEPRDNPLFLRAARHYGVTPQTLFVSYCRRLLPAQAFLCGRLGIALEAHPQNMVVDFRGLAGSSPDIHFWYRDLGGIRLHGSRLAKALEDRGWDQQLQVPQFWPGSATSTDSARDLSSKFVYSLLQNHLGELIRSVCRTGFEEADFWTVVDDVLTEHRALMGADLEERVFSSTWDLKAMWTMRVDSRITEYTFQPVQNPLLTYRKDADS
jgi:siderophore synthetase component